ncbi:MAG: ABC1 kinase family protein [Deltaproteobacteria bacterium]
MMIKKSGFVRSLTILRLFVGIFWAFYSLKFHRIFRGSRWVENRRQELYISQARRFRLTAVELGGLLIKLGQFFSTRVDLLPQNSIQELAGLQDEVRSESFSDIKQVIEEEFQLPLETIFKSIDPNPLASASLGQVHQGELEDGSRVAVKVQRPGIDDLVNIDLRAILRVVSLIKLFTDWNRFIDLDAIYKEFAITIRAELNYLQEGRNAETVAANFDGDAEIIIPRIFWEYTRSRVLTMEYLGGIKISETDQLKSVGVDCTRVAEKLLAAYVKQVLIDGFFHADPHPGNLFVTPEGKIIMLDFGMVGTITPAVRKMLVEMSLALVSRDFTQVVSYLVKLGFIRINAESDALIRAISVFVEGFLGTGEEVTEADLKGFLKDLEVLLYEQPFQIPANYTFLGRALGTLYGICLGLDPQISIIDVARPYVDEIVPGQNSIFTLVKDQSKRIGKSLIQLPPLAEAVLRKAERGDLNINVPLGSLNNSLDNNTRAIKMAAWAIVWGVSVLASVILLINGWGQVAKWAGIFAIIVFLIFIKSGLAPARRRAPHPPVLMKRDSKL